MEHLQGNYYYNRKFKRILYSTRNYPINTFKNIKKSILSSLNKSQFNLNLTHVKLPLTTPSFRTIFLHSNCFLSNTRNFKLWTNAHVIWFDEPIIYRLERVETLWERFDFDELWNELLGHLKYVNVNGHNVKMCQWCQDCWVQKL